MKEVTVLDKNSRPIAVGDTVYTPLAGAGGGSGTHDNRKEGVVDAIVTGSQFEPEIAGCKKAAATVKIPPKVVYTDEKGVQQQSNPKALANMNTDKEKDDGKGKDKAGEGDGGKSKKEMRESGEIDKKKTRKADDGVGSPSTGMANDVVSQETQQDIISPDAENETDKRKKGKKRAGINEEERKEREE